MIFFAPKWKSRNWKKRKNWIEKCSIMDLETIKILEKIATNDNNSTVKRLARLKLEELFIKPEEINSPQKSSETLLNDKENKKHTPLKSQEQLIAIARSVKSIKERTEAIRKLDPKMSDILIDIAKNDKKQHIRKEAIEKLDPLKHQEVLADIAKNDLTEKNRIFVIRKLDPIISKSTIENLALNDSNYAIRSEAVKKLNPKVSQSALVEIARNECDVYVCQIVAKKIKSIDSIDDIVDIFKGDFKNDVNQYILSIIIKKIDKIDSYDILTDIVINSKNVDIRKAVVKKLDVKHFHSLLIDISQNDSSTKVRLQAIMKFNLDIFQKTLVEIAKNDSSKKIKLAAIKKLDHTQFHDELLEVFKDNMDFDIRIYLLKKLDPLKYQKEIIDFILNEDNNDNLNKIVEVVDSSKFQNAYVEIYQKTNNEFLKNTLLSTQIVDQGILRKAVFEVDNALRLKIIEKLDSFPILEEIMKVPGIFGLESSVHAMERIMHIYLKNNKNEKFIDSIFEEGLNFLNGTHTHYLSIREKYYTDGSLDKGVSFSEDEFFKKVFLILADVYSYLDEDQKNTIQKYNDKIFRKASTESYSFWPFDDGGDGHGPQTVEMHIPELVFKI